MQVYRSTVSILLWLSLLLISSININAQPSKGVVVQPPAYEMQQTWMNLEYWLDVMLNHYHYTHEEASVVTGMNVEDLKQRARSLNENTMVAAADTINVLPYPGGRHPRIGFLDGAVDPIRATKAGVFLPWEEDSYLVVDFPEAIFSHQGLIFLAHTHIPTLYGDITKKMAFADWRRSDSGQLSQAWGLPNDISFGASIVPKENHVQMELWLRNGSSEILRDLRTQVCIMLKGASAFNQLTNENKRFTENAAAVQSDHNRWVLTAWEPCGRTWGNEDVPCLHADPVFADCPPGETVKATGRIWFYEGEDVEKELKQVNLTN